MFRHSVVENNCLRCKKTVYPTDKIGPLKDFTFFHSGCFRCVECSSKLTLRTYYNNQHSQDDKEVYCNQHVPKIGPGHFASRGRYCPTREYIPILKVTPVNLGPRASRLCQCGQFHLYTVTWVILGLRGL